MTAIGFVGDYCHYDIAQCFELPRRSKYDAGQYLLPVRGWDFECWVWVVITNIAWSIPYNVKAFCLRHIIFVSPVAFFDLWSGIYSRCESTLVCGVSPQDTITMGHHYFHIYFRLPSSVDSDDEEADQEWEGKIKDLKNSLNRTEEVLLSKLTV